jgi:hypothetical protein
MDERRMRREGRLGDDSSAGHSWPGQPGEEDAKEDWRSFRDRVDQEWRERRAGGGPAGPPDEDQAAWRNQPDAGPGSGPADFNVEDYRSRLLGGPGSELFGGSSAPLYDSAEFAAFRVEAEAEYDAQRDSVPPALPQQAKNEYVDERFEEFADPGPSSGLVRPYFRTRGRTRPAQDLAIEALVSTSEHGRLLDRVRVPEHRSICDLCLDTRSVAEVAALLRLPLGVVRVLIGDVAGLGLVLVHSGSSTVGDRPSVEFMERVLSGLRRI